MIQGLIKQSKEHDTEDDLEHDAGIAETEIGNHEKTEEHHEAEGMDPVWQPPGRERDVQALANSHLERQKAQEQEEKQADGKTAGEVAWKQQFDTHEESEK